MLHVPDVKQGTKANHSFSVLALRRERASESASASKAQYTRAMRAMTNASIADLTDPNTQIALEHLHPAPIQPITAVEARDLPPSPEVDESTVLGAVRRMNPNAAAGPDHMSPWLLQLLVNSEVSPEAGVTGLSALTRLVARLASGNIPDQSLPLLAAAILLPICPKPNKIRPIAIGQALRRLVTKALLPKALGDTRSFLAPQQLANVIPSAMDAIVHDARLLLRRHGNDPNYVMVTIDAKNSFNACSRQTILDTLPNRAPSLARFTNAVYAKTTPLLVLPSHPPVLLRSREGTQQGDPANMLLFSLTVQPLIRRISQTCNLELNRWYADDGLLIGRIAEVKRALQILRDEGPAHNFYMHVGKTKSYWPTIDTNLLSHITEEIPIDVISDGGVDILGAPVGSRNYMEVKLQQKLDACNQALADIADLPDARIKFHLHWICGSACKVQQLFRLVPPDVSLPYAEQFDKDQMAAYSRLNNVELTPSAIAQIRLPFRKGGHGFTPIAPLLHVSYSTSLIDSAPMREPHPQHPSIDRYIQKARSYLKIFVRNLSAQIQLPGFALIQNLTGDLGHFEPQALAARPERTH